MGGRLVLVLAMLAALFGAPPPMFAASNVLRGASVTPPSGTTATTFTLRVEYEGHPALKVAASVGWRSVDLIRISGTAEAGTWSGSISNLPPGTWPVAFAAVVSQGNSPVLSALPITVSSDATLPTPSPSTTPGSPPGGSGAESPNPPPGDESRGGPMPGPTAGTSAPASPADPGGGTSDGPEDPDDPETPGNADEPSPAPGGASSSTPPGSGPTGGSGQSGGPGLSAGSGDGAGGGAGSDASGDPSPTTSASPRPSGSGHGSGGIGGASFPAGAPAEPGASASGEEETLPVETGPGSTLAIGTLVGILAATMLAVGLLLIVARRRRAGEGYEPITALDTAAILERRVLRRAKKVIEPDLIVSSIGIDEHRLAERRVRRRRRTGRDGEPTAPL